MVQKGVIERYRKYLPVSSKTPVVTLQEGATPLLRAFYLEKLLVSGKETRIWLKYEGANPTGSFKDRGMTLAISKAVEKNARAVVCASTGNTAASAAAYSARAGLKCIVVIPEGAIALGKLSQSLIHGAQVFAVKGNFDEALKLVLELVDKHPVELVNSINPFRIEGQKTAAFEIVEALGRAPDYHFIPVGNAGNITAYWKGYREFASGEFRLAVSGLRLTARENKLPTINYQLSTRGLPHMMGFQASGAAPIVRGKPVLHPKTVATAIRIGNPASWKQAEAARDESGGVIDSVTDAEILRAYRILAQEEGVFAEPASAASVAGLIKYSGKGYFRNKKGIRDIVCTLTGHGLKDPDTAITSSVKPKVIAPSLKEILKQARL